jgi:hypothetical protein
MAKPVAFLAARLARAREFLRKNSRLGTLRKHSRLLAIGGCFSLLLAVSVGGAVRACRANSQTEKLEGRIARIESVLGVGSAVIQDAAVAPRAEIQDAAVALSDAQDASTGSATAERKGACAVAKIEAYEAWQDAVVKAKANAQTAAAPCNDMWERKKQACYYAAFAGLRGTQGARDAAIKGGAAAREAVKNVKDDPKNEAIAHARAASAAAWTACDDENEL